MCSENIPGAHSSAVSKPTGEPGLPAVSAGLVEDLVLPFFRNQLLEMVHDLVAPSYDRLNF